MTKKRIIPEGQYNFVLKLPLVDVTKEAADFLNKRFEICGRIYNEFQKKLLRKYVYITQTRAYKDAPLYYKDCKRDENGNLLEKTKSDIIRDYTIPYEGTKGGQLHIFSKFGFFIYIRSLYSNTYSCIGINSQILQSIAQTAWTAWEKKLNGKGKHINLKKEGEYNSYSIGVKQWSNGVSFYGIDITNIATNCFGIKMNDVKSGKNVKWLNLKFGIKTDYEKKSMMNEIRQISFTREYIRGKWKHYVIFTLEGKKPNKGRKLGTGCVGIDIGCSTIAVVSDDVVYMDTIAKNIPNATKELKRLNRKIDRSRRAMNPENYNENGTTKKKSEITGWVTSNRCKKLQDKRKEISRKQAACRKKCHIELANRLLSLGNEFIVENNTYAAMAKRSKETKINVKGKCMSKKRFGRSIRNHAPATLITLLENKVKGFGGKFARVDIKNAGSQFDFTDQTFTPHDLPERRITLHNGNTHCRDTIAAFNIKNLDYNNEKLKVYNVQTMQEEYPKFCRMEQEEITRLHNSHEPISCNFGIKKN